MVLPTKSALASDVAAFAVATAEADARWSYAVRTATYTYIDKNGHRWENSLCGKTVAPLTRFIGCNHTRSSFGFRCMRILSLGSVGAAREAYFGNGHREGWPDPYRVGPVEPWQIGHVYFARVKNFPHVVKIGFSRRVHDRIEDIETQNRITLDVFALRVGTHADEYWWQHNWRRFSIAGEWFFDPRTSDRVLPGFLAEKAEAA